MLARVFPDEYGRRDVVPPPREAISAMPPIRYVLSMPNGEQRETTFEEAQKIFAGHFPVSDGDERETKTVKPRFDTNGRSED